MKTTKPSDEAKQQTAFFTEMTEALRENCEQALKTNLRLQEESGRWWSSVLNPAACSQQWQEQLKSTTRTANGLLPLLQKPTSELLDLAEKNSRTGAELLKKALDAAQSCVPGESQAKWTELYSDTLHAARCSTEAISEISSKALDSWAAFIRHNVPGGQAQKTA